MADEKVLIHNARIKVAYDMNTKSDFTHFLFDISPVTKEEGRNVEIDANATFVPGITIKGVTCEPEFLAQCFEEVAAMIRKRFVAEKSLIIQKLH